MANCLLSNRINPYQIGDIYITTSTINPSVRFGGIWEKLENVFLFGASDTHILGETGGEETHTLTIDEMPSHNHGTGLLSGNLDGTYFWITSPSSYEGTFNTYTTGGDQPHNNMPPYLTVYMWKRIA